MSEDPSGIPMSKGKVHLTQGSGLKLSYPRFQDLVDELSPWLSRDGMFVAIESPPPVGTVLHFEIAVGEHLPLGRGQAEVVWARSSRHVGEEPRGMGLRFQELDEATSTLVDRMVEKRAADGLPEFQLNPGGNVLESPGPSLGIGPIASAGQDTLPAPEPSELDLGGAESTAEGELDLSLEPGQVWPDLTVRPDALKATSSSTVTPAPSGAAEPEDVLAPLETPGLEPAVEESPMPPATFPPTEPAPGPEEPIAAIVDVPPVGVRGVAATTEAGKASDSAGFSRRFWLLLLLALLLLAAAAFQYRGLWLGLFKAESPGEVAQVATPPSQPANETIEEALAEPGSGEEGQPLDSEGQAEAEVSHEVEAPSPPSASPPADVSTSGTLTEIVGVTWRETASGTVLTIVGDGGIAGRYEIVPVGGERPRLLVKIDGASRGFSPPTLEVGTREIHRIRTGLHQVAGGDQLHLVADLTGSAVKATRVEPSGSTLVVELSGGGS